MEKKSKILSLLGFAIKARQVRCGVNAVETLKGNVKVLIICSTASENTFKNAVSLKNKFGAKLIVSKDYKIEEIVNKSECKLIAVLGQVFGDAIIENLDEHFVEYSEGLVK